MKKIAVVMFTVLMFGCEKENINTDCVEKIDPNAVCTQQYDPVCGCNNKTYGNACVANASGITNYVKGECKK